MKICFVTNFYHPVTGGVESHVYYFAKELIKMGHDITVFTSDSSREGRIKKKEEIIDGIKVRRFNTLFKIGDFGVIYPGVFKAIRKGKFDLVHLHVYRHFHNFMPFFVKGKYVLTPHWPNYPRNVRSFSAYYLTKVFDLLLGKIVLNKFDKLLMITGIEEKWFIKRFSLDKRKFKIIPDGVPKDYLKLRDRKKLRKKLKLKENDIRVLMFSRIHKSKGFEQVIKVAKDFPKVKFVVGGIDGGYKKDLINLVKKLKLKNVIFIGSLFEKDKLDAFRVADIFIHPSRYEGFGIVILEAFSQGNAVITSNQGGMPWVIDKAGLIFKIDDLDDLKKKLKRLVDNKRLRKELSKKGLKRVKNFTWERIAKDLEKVYLSL